MEIKVSELNCDAEFFKGQKVLYVKFVKGIGQQMKLEYVLCAKNILTIIESIK